MNWLAFFVALSLFALWIIGLAAGVTPWMPWLVFIVGLLALLNFMQGRRAVKP